MVTDISPEARQSVIRSLPELDEIKDESLRNKIVDAWAYSLDHSSFNAIEQFPDLPINRDLLVACALCHDVGKPFEFDPENQRRWQQNPAASGFPAIRHTQYGTHVCLTLGLPEEVCHAAGCHSGEGELVQRSLHVTLVHQADYAFWGAMQSGGLMET